MAEEKITGDQLLESVKYDHFREFVRLTVTYKNRLLNFLGTMDNPDDLLHRFVKGIDKTEDPVSEAMMATCAINLLKNQDEMERIKADDRLLPQEKQLYPKLLNAMTLMQNDIKSEYQRLEHSTNRSGRILYGLMGGLFYDLDLPGIDTDWSKYIARTFHLVPQDVLNISDMTNPNGIHVQKVFFYKGDGTDDDGQRSFTALRNYYQTLQNGQWVDKPGWKTVDYGSYLHIQSVDKPTPVYIFIVNPDYEDKGSDDIDAHLEKANLKINEIDHGGHSFYLYRTLERTPSNIALFFARSCGAASDIDLIHRSAPNAHIICTSGTGTMLVNGPIQDEKNKWLTQGRDIEWKSFWEALEKRGLMRIPDFQYYIRPDRNFANQFLQAIQTINDLLSQTDKESGSQLLNLFENTMETHTPASDTANFFRNNFTGIPTGSTLQMVPIVGPQMVIDRTLPHSILSPAIGALLNGFRILRHHFTEGKRSAAPAWIKNTVTVFNIVVAPALETYLFLHLAAPLGLGHLLGVGLLGFLLLHPVMEILFQKRPIKEALVRTFQRAPTTLLFMAPYLLTIPGVDLWTPAAAFIASVTLHTFINLSDARGLQRLAGNLIVSQSNKNLMSLFQRLTKDISSFDNRRNLQLLPVETLPRSLLAPALQVLLSGSMSLTRHIRRWGNPSFPSMEGLSYEKTLSKQDDRFQTLKDRLRTELLETLLGGTARPVSFDIKRLDSTVIELKSRPAMETPDTRWNSFIRKNLSRVKAGDLTNAEKQALQDILRSDESLAQTLSYAKTNPDFIGRVVREILQTIEQGRPELLPTVLSQMALLRAAGTSLAQELDLVDIQDEDILAQIPFRLGLGRGDDLPLFAMAVDEQVRINYDAILKRSIILQSLNQVVGQTDLTASGQLTVFDVSALFDNTTPTDQKNVLINALAALAQKVGQLDDSQSPQVVLISRTRQNADQIRSELSRLLPSFSKTADRVDILTPQEQSFVGKDRTSLKQLIQWWTGSKGGLVNALEIFTLNGDSLDSTGLDETIKILIVDLVKFTESIQRDLEEIRFISIQA
ncbi:MAG TPA: hypothetical protein PK876_03040 [Elusimicrobiota bacterium]|nr:hypothetical protein [Elusimicrobiota bacterium]